MIAIENPRGVLSTELRAPDQEINPFEFGHNEAKRTNLWLRNLPPLMATELVYPHKCFVEATNGKNRARERARTFPGIARAMADQWGRFGIKEVSQNERGSEDMSDDEHNGSWVW